jgi:hypothetical protein
MVNNLMRIAIGDPDTIDNVATFLPGIDSRGDSAVAYTSAAQNIHESARLSDRYSSTAVVMGIVQWHHTPPALEPARRPDDQ